MSNLNFEEAMKKLDNIVEVLEEGELTLDDSLEKFKEGIGFLAYCNKKLDEVEKKISILIEESGGKIREQPFYLDGEGQLE